MNIKPIVNSLLIGALMVAPYTQAANTSTVKGKNQITKEQAASSDKAIKSLEKEQNKLLKAIHESALDGHRDVLKATRLLAKEGKEEEVITLLQEAIGKLDVAITDDPSLNLLPIDADVSISELITTPELVKAETDTVIDFLKDHKVQAARAILEPMKDEMVMSHAYLPMGTYPDSIKLATKYLVDGKREDALATLTTALSTIVIERSIVPLAIVRTENLLKTASEQNKIKDKAKAHELLNAAQEQLEVATLLGYTNKESKEYEAIKEQVKAIKKEIDGKNAVEKMYDKIREFVKQLIAKEKDIKK